MRIHKPFLLSAIAVTTALALSGCVQPSSEVPPAVTSTPNQTDSSTYPTGEPNPTTPPVAVDLEDNASELKEAQYMFPQANATTSFTKDQVQLALYSSFGYFQKALTTPYFLNGSYEAENYPDTRLQEELKPFFSNTALADLVSKTSDRATLLDNGKPAYQQWALSVVYFPILDGGDRNSFIPQDCLNQNTTPSLPQSDNYQGTPSESTTEQKEEIILGSVCTAGPPEFSGINYEERVNDTGETVLTVSTVGTVKDIIVKNGETGTQTVTYNFVVDVSPNEYADWKNGVHSMAISHWYDPKATWTAWQAD